MPLSMGCGRDGLDALLLAPDDFTGRGGLNGGGLRFVDGSGDLTGGILGCLRADDILFGKPAGGGVWWLTRLRSREISHA